MPHAKGKYHWWDLDGTELAGRLHAILMPIQLGDDDYDNDWEEFRRRNPSGAYAWTVNSRHEVLEQAIIALRPIQKFVRLRKLPIPTSRGNITRDEWLRATIDLFLFRLGGIRDHCLHLVARVFELQLRSLDVRVKTVIDAPGIKGTRIEQLIGKVAMIAPHLREERNLRAHEGHQRRLTDEPFFAYLSLFEEVGSNRPKGRTLNMQLLLPEEDRKAYPGVTTSDEYDLPGVYRGLAEKLEGEFIPLGDEIVATVRDLTDELCHPFSERYESKA